MKSLNTIIGTYWMKNVWHTSLELIPQVPSTCLVKWEVIQGTIVAVRCHEDDRHRFRGFPLFYYSDLHEIKDNNSASAIVLDSSSRENSCSFGATAPQLAGVLSLELEFNTMSSALHLIPIPTGTQQEIFTCGAWYSLPPCSCTSGDEQGLYMIV